MQQRSETTRRKIMAAAQAQFSRSGYDATSVADICQAAGVSKGAFYHHFISKQAAFQALMEDWLNSISTQMGSLLNTAPDVPAGLLRLASIAGPVFQQARGQFPMFLEFWTQSSRDPHLWETAIAPYRQFQSLFAGVLRKGIEEGTIRPIDPQLAAQALMAQAIGIVLQGVMDPEGAAWDQAAQQGFHLIIKGLLPDQEDKA